MAAVRWCPYTNHTTRLSNGNNNESPKEQKGSGIYIPNLSCYNPFEEDEELQRQEEGHVSSSTSISIELDTENKQHFPYLEEEHDTHKQLGAINLFSGIDSDNAIVKAKFDDASHYKNTGKTTAICVPPSSSNCYNQKPEFSIPVRSIPTWGIYFRDQCHNIPKYKDRNVCCLKSSRINSKVSLYFEEIDMRQIATDVTVQFCQCPPANNNVLKENGSMQSDYSHFGICSIEEAGQLPSKLIFHATDCGSNYAKWVATIRGCLHGMLRKHYRTISFPCMSTLSEDVDQIQAAKAALSAFRCFLERYESEVDRIVICLKDQTNIMIYRRLMQVFFPVS